MSLLLLISTGWALDPTSMFAANYNVGKLNVTTFEQTATLNGSSVTLKPTDTLTMSGGTLTVAGNGTAYSALLGTGTGHKTGFAWGSGGTISLGSGVTLNINVLSQTPVLLTQSGTGTLNLTSTQAQKLQLVQNSGILNTSGSLVTFGTSSISGTTNVDGEFSANDKTGQTNTLTVGGTLDCEEGFYSSISEVKVSPGGTITASTAHMDDGGLFVGAGSQFKITNAATFTKETAITNYGTVQVGANSVFNCTTVGNYVGGVFHVGDNAVFSDSDDESVAGNSGTFIADGDVSFDVLFNGSQFTASGNVKVGDDLICYAFDDNNHVHHTGDMTIQGTGTFEGTSTVSGGATIDVAETSSLGKSLTLTEGSTFKSGGSITSAANISVTDSTLSSGGNITSSGSLVTSGNSTLGLTNRLLGSSLGNLISTGGINLASTTTIDTDLSGLNTIRQPTLLVHMVAGDSTDDFQINSAATNVNAVADLFGTSSVLRKIYATDNNVGYDIYAALRSVEDYANEEGLDKPVVDAGGSLDDLIATVDPSSPVGGMVDNFLDETDKNAINQTLYNLAGGYGVENIFSMTLTNLGQAGSPFFFGRTAGLPSSKARCQCSCLGKLDLPVGERELWGAPLYQSLQSDGNSYQHGFNLHEAGMIVGVRKQYTSSTSAGILFAYQAPRLRQSGSLAGYDAHFHSDIDMDDYQYAVHLEHQTEKDFRFSLFLGGGSQTLDLDRHAWGTAANQTVMNQSFSGDTKGNSLSVTAYLSRPFCLTDRLTLSPVIGIDSMHAWLYSFGETASGTGNWQNMTNLSEGNFYSPVGYGKTQYNRNLARAGLWLDYCGTKGGISGQAFYGTQLGGDAFAILPISTMGGAYNSSLYGYNVGRDSLNLGGGAWRYLDEAQAVTVSANYNYLTLNDAEASNVTAAVAWRF